MNDDTSGTGIGERSLEADLEKVNRQQEKSVENSVIEVREHQFQEKMVKEDEFLKAYFMNHEKVAGILGRDSTDVEV